ncbi:GNAT family N-acetyltransferase [Nocardiopsis rhodophaea]|uniref:GNAT family N-acetyltransferase n=1 Tax=Nocardiopsis rhodophaea TaxID=280238 RepID=UPI0031E179CE
MSEQRFVRSARLEDIDDVVAIQVAAWRSMYGQTLPAAVLDELTGQEAGTKFREQWRGAVESPPTSQHRLLVATDERKVMGFASLGPAEDDDLWPGTDAEIYALHVHPDHLHRGHGSRLLNAAVDHLVDDGFHRVVIWTLEADNPLRDFAESAGWRPDGARRELDMGERVPMVRLHAAISV